MLSAVQPIFPQQRLKLRERAQFIEKRAKEAADFESHQQRELQAIRQQLDAIGENYDAAGKPYKKRFSWV